MTKMNKAIENMMSELTVLVKKQNELKDIIDKASAAITAAQSQLNEIDPAIQNIVAMAMEMEVQTKDRPVNRELVSIVARKAGDQKAKTWYLATSVARAFYGSSSNCYVKRVLNSCVWGQTTWFDSTTVNDIGGLKMTGKLSRWIDEISLAEAKKAADEYIQIKGKRAKVRKSYDVNEVIRLHKEGMTYRNIADTIGITYEMVCYIIRKYKNE